MNVSLLDLKAQYRQIAPEVQRAVAEVFDSQYFVLGPQVARLEEKIADYCKSRYAVGVASGSDALLVSLMALDIGAGDEVITTPYTFFATLSAITRLGAKPVLVDIEPETYNMDTSLIEALITPRTKAIIPVHLYGQCADMQPILELAKEYKLAVIEDAAQAIGATYAKDDNIRQAGSMGISGCLSFFPTKNLGGCGDGGMVLSNNPEFAEKVRMLRVHGSKVRYYHQLVGCNSRLDSLQAAVLLVKLKYLDEWTNKRIKNAEYYNKLFKNAGLEKQIILPQVQYNNRHVYNQYVVRVDNRDKLREHLKQNGVITEIYYPLPLHLQECFAYLGYTAGDLPNAEAAAECSLALPIYAELTEQMQYYVVDKIKEFYEKIIM